MKIKCPAKINLFLEVLDKRNDGYHNVLLLNQSISLFDEIIIKKNKNKKIVINCNNSNVPTNKDNSVYKACRVFFEEYKIKSQGLDIFINKNIPLEAGLAGESTDAAGTLKLLYKLYNINDSSRNVIKLAIKVGSDVPFFMFDSRALVKGKGDIIIQKKNSKKEYYVVIKPNINLKTKDMFASLDKINRVIKNNVEIGYNAFELICDKRVLKYKELLMNNGADKALLTGSGSCVYGIFYNKRQAKTAYKNLKINNNCFFVKQYNK